MLIKNQMKNKTLIGAFIAVFIVSIYTCYVYNKGMPTAEGWYSYYSNCILNGNVVYSDFEYLFTPVYMYLISGIIKIFGYNIIVLRVVGIIIYASLTVIIYYTLSRIFSITASVVATVTGIFYLQSEAYTVFYDYVRIMDFFAYLSILFMTLSVLEWQKNEKCYKNICLWGVFNSFFFLVKQNMGGLFLVYSILLIIFCSIIFKWNIKMVFKNMFCFFTFFPIPIAFLLGITALNGITDTMIDSIFFSAMEAKGGIVTILFEWIKRSSPDFFKVFLWGVLFLIVLKINEQFNKEYPKQEKKYNVWLIIYWLVTSVLIIFICTKEEFGNYFLKFKNLDVTIPFIVTVVLLFYLLIKTIYCFIRDKKAMVNIAILGLLGAFFTLCYGAGTSGGLAIGESALGVGILICILFDSFKYKGSEIFRLLLIVYCMCLSFCCISLKLVNPCYWWGIDTSSIYNDTEETSIPLLKGILVSKEEKNMYESVVEAVQKNTKEEDPIFCFPHIPIFYLLCDRPDSDTYTKVQWFDVSSQNSLNSDIKLLEKNPPKALVIYNLNDETYQGHEKLFNSGKESGTKKMRNALYDLINTYNYEYQGNFVSTNNNIAVFTLRDENKLCDEVFEMGDGTKDNPYLIDSVHKLVNLAMMINQGNSFENTYFKQVSDIDINDVFWVPIGYKNTFLGVYDLSDYTVYNINSSNKNINNPFGNELFCFN